MSFTGRSTSFTFGSPGGGSGGMSDPHVPADGTQNITGGLAVSGAISGDSAAITGALSAGSLTVGGVPLGPTFLSFWGYPNTGASATINMYQSNNNLFGSIVRTPVGGSLARIVVTSNTPIAGSAAVFEFRNGTAVTTLGSVSMAVGAQYASATFAIGAGTFSAGNDLLARVVTDGSYTSTTADFIMFVWVHEP